MRIDLKNVPDHLSEELETICRKYGEATISKAIYKMIANHMDLYSQIERLKTQLAQANENVRYYEESLVRIKRAEDLKNEIFSKIRA